MKITNRIKEKAQNFTEGRQITIAFLGDSVTQGCFELYRTRNDGVQTEFDSQKAYHHKLIGLLQSMYPQVPFNIINAGISGNTAEDGLKRIESSVISYKPDLCVVCFGLNDANKGDTYLDTFKASLADIFKKLKESDIETIYMTPNTMSYYESAELSDFMKEKYKWSNSVQSKGLLDLFVSEGKKIAESSEVLICDCYAKWKKLYENGCDTTRLLANRINHPTPDMHWLFAWSLFEMIMEF